MTEPWCYRDNNPLSEVADQSIPATRSLPSPRMLTRRQWLTASAAGLVTMGLGGAAEAVPRLTRKPLPSLNAIADAGTMLRGQGIKKRGYVYEIAHNNVFPMGGYQPSKPAVFKMLQTLMMKITGESTPKKAWTRMVGPGDRVGILVDAEGNAATKSRRALIDCIVLSLKQVGIQEKDIIIWTHYGRLLTGLGYNLNWKGPGVKILGADQMGYDNRYALKLNTGLFGSQLGMSKIVTQLCSHVINVAALEDHPIMGCHLCLTQQAISSLQKGKSLERYWGGARSIGQIAAWPIVQQKFVLHIIDGLAGAFNGNLRVWQPQTLIGGTDAVAVDRFGFSMIENKRQSSGESAITGTRRAPVHINNAALQNAGIANLQQITHQKIIVR